MENSQEVIVGKVNEGFDWLFRVFLLDTTLDIKELSRIAAVVKFLLRQSELCRRQKVAAHQAF